MRLALPRSHCRATTADRSATSRTTHLTIRFLPQAVVPLNTAMLSQLDKALLVVTVVQVPAPRHLAATP